MRFRRATTGHEAIAPRHSTRVSPLFKPLVEQQLDGQTTASASQASQKPVNAKPTTDRASIQSRSSIGSQQIYRVRESSSTVESEYGEIKHAAAFDEDSLSGGLDVSGEATNQGLSPPAQSVATSVVSDDEEEVDAFDALLHDDDRDDSDGEEEENDDEEEGETVSTIRQDKNDYMSGVSKYANFRLSSGGSTAASGSSVSTMKQHRLSFVSSDASASTFSKESQALHFRDESLVRPNEQKGPSGARARGRLHLSPMQRTPMQARKWRALAAEAQANDRAQRAAKNHNTKSSLSERHPNVAANQALR
jgi:hypothetical protein